MTRQRRWALKMRANGRCMRCGNAQLGTRQHCRTCADKNAQFVRPAVQRWKARHPERVLAHKAVEAAVMRGLLKRPTACSRCDTSESKIQGHHHDYSKPLEVEWLCYRCHAAVEGRGK